VEWIVEIADEFKSEFDELPEEVAIRIAALSALLKQFGPNLGAASRRYAQGLRSRQYEGDEIRRRGRRLASGICLRSAAQGCFVGGGNKSGVGETRFYRQLIAKADERFEAH
jgi:hypothetical protein